MLTHELAGDLAQFDVARWIEVCATWADGGGAGGGGGGWGRIPVRGGVGGAALVFPVVEGADVCGPDAGSGGAP